MNEQKYHNKKSRKATSGFKRYRYLMLIATVISLITPLHAYNMSPIGSPLIDTFDAFRSKVTFLVSAIDINNDPNLAEEIMLKVLRRDTQTDELLSVTARLTGISNAVANSYGMYIITYETMDFDKDKVVEKIGAIPPRMAKPILDIIDSDLGMGLVLKSHVSHLVNKFNKISTDKVPELIYDTNLLVKSDGSEVPHRAPDYSYQKNGGSTTTTKPSSTTKPPTTTKPSSPTSNSGTSSTSTKNETQFYGSYDTSGLNNYNLTLSDAIYKIFGKLNYTAMIGNSWDTNFQLIKKTFGVEPWAYNDSQVFNFFQCKNSYILNTPIEDFIITYFPENTHPTINWKYDFSFKSEKEAKNFLEKLNQAIMKMDTSFIVYENEDGMEWIDMKNFGGKMGTIITQYFKHESHYSIMLDIYGAAY